VLKQRIDTTTPHGRLVFDRLGALDEFQRELIVEGANEGLAAARGRVGGRKPGLTPGQIDHARKLYADGEHTVAQIAGLLGVSRQAIYRAPEPEAAAAPAAGWHTSRLRPQPVLIRHGRAIACLEMSVRLTYDGSHRVHGIRAGPRGGRT